jgi:hypothetical protein
VICAGQEVGVVVTVVVTVLTDVTVIGPTLLHEVIVWVEAFKLGDVPIKAEFEIVETEVTVLVTVDADAVIVVVEVQRDSVVAIVFEQVIGEACTMGLVEAVSDCIEDNVLLVVDVEESDAIIVAVDVRLALEAVDVMIQEQAELSLEVDALQSAKNVGIPIVAV